MIDLALSTRDGWCTPKWLTCLLPQVALDPASNPRSTVRAGVAYSLECGQDGLERPWFGLVFVNPPYSDPLPWANKLVDEYVNLDGCGFLVNTDSSTAWWKQLCVYLTHRFDFHKRIQFSPPDGVRTSSNSKPQTLLCDGRFWKLCDRRLSAHGMLWRRA